MAKVKTNSTKKETLKESAEASKELAAYLKKHKLDPDKDWTNDPTHGKKVKKLVKLIQLGQEKAVTMPSEKKLKKPEVHPKVKTVKESLSYDYPDIDGKPMSKELRKKYRAKMRSLLKANMDPKDASKKALEFCTTSLTNPPAPKAKKEKVEKETKEVKTNKKDKKTKEVAKTKETKKVKKEKETSKKTIKSKPVEED